jgi:hypothetical protein
MLMWLLLIMVLAEWWLYSMKTNALRVQGSGFGVVAQSPQPPAQSILGR